MNYTNVKIDNVDYMSGNSTDVPKFEFVSGYEDCGLRLPVRGSENAAGYDFEVAEDTIVPPLRELVSKTTFNFYNNRTWDDEDDKVICTLPEIKDIVKRSNTKLTLVPTGVKCKLAPDQYLELSVRSSTPLNYYLVLANGVGRLLF